MPKVLNRQFYCLYCGQDDLSIGCRYNKHIGSKMKNSIKRFFESRRLIGTFILLTPNIKKQDALVKNTRSVSYIVGQFFGLTYPIQNS